MTRYRFYALGLLILGVGGIVAGVLIHRWWSAPEVIVGPPVHGVTTVTVNAPALAAAVVTQYVSDPAGAAQLMAALHEVQTLTETVATLKAQGSGPVVYVDRPVPGPAGETVVDHEVHFKDGRLTFDASSLAGTAHYSLTQAFELQVALGRDAAGKPTAAVQAFELWPGDTRTPLTDLKTTFITATATAPRWRLGLAIQAGIAGGLDTSRTAQYGAVVGAQWLRRGSSRAAEDTSLAVLTPVAFIGKDMFEPGILPVSLNLGKLVPHQPLKDIWLSPLLTTKRLGLSITATF